MSKNHINCKCLPLRMQKGVALCKQNNASSKGQIQTSIGVALHKLRKSGASRSRRPTYPNRKVSPSKHNKAKGGASLTKSTLSSKGLTFRLNNKIRHLHNYFYKGGLAHQNWLHSYIWCLFFEHYTVHVFDDHADRAVNYFFGRLPQICFEFRAWKWMEPAISLIQAQCPLVDETQSVRHRRLHRRVPV